MVKDIIAKLSTSTEPAIRTSVGDNEFGLYEGDIVALLPLSTPAIVGRLLSARGTDFKVQCSDGHTRWHPPSDLAPVFGTSGVAKQALEPGDFVRVPKLRTAAQVLQVRIGAAQVQIFQLRLADGRTVWHSLSDVRPPFDDAPSPLPIVIDASGMHASGGQKSAAAATTTKKGSAVIANVAMFENDAMVDTATLDERVVATRAKVLANRSAASGKSRQTSHRQSLPVSALRANFDVAASSATSAIRGLFGGGGGGGGAKKGGGGVAGRAAMFENASRLTQSTQRQRMHTHRRWPTCGLRWMDNGCRTKQR